MNKAHLISLTTAASLGYAANFAVDGLTASAAVSRSVEQSVQVALSAGAKNTIDNFALNQVCAKFDTELGLDGADVCVAAEVQSINLTRDAQGEWQAHAFVSKAGTWSPGAPQ